MNIDSKHLKNKSIEKELKKELKDLIQNPITDELKREKYRALQPKIKEYEKIKSATDSVQAYEIQIEQNKYSPIHQKLENQNSVKNQGHTKDLKNDIVAKNINKYKQLIDERVYKDGKVIKHSGQSR